MKTRGYIVGVAFITLSLLGALTVYGGPGGRRSGQHFEQGGSGFPFRVLHTLELTDEQQKQIQTITESHKEKMRELRKELRAINSEVMDKLFTSEKVTIDSFASASERVAALEAQLYKERLAMSIEVHDVLTAEQLTKAAESIAKKKALRAEKKKSSPSEEKKDGGTQ
jgi:Spy/CpxP family protein refolding chaperone